MICLLGGVGLYKYTRGYQKRGDEPFRPVSINHVGKGLNWVRYGKTAIVSFGEIGILTE